MKRRVEMLNKLRKNNKKGFTLVELIVVLVILAILAALLIPALTGYIDRAKEKQVIAETRQAVMAAQTLIDEEYANGNTLAFATGEVPASPAPGTVYEGEIKKLAEVKGSISDITFSGGKIATLKYTQAGTNGKKCTYTEANNTQYEITT